MRRALVSSALLLMAISVPAAEPAGPADRVYLNGVIFTADANNSRASALAIRDGRILYVGSDITLARYVGPATVKVDLQGRFLMPGLVDGHMSTTISAPRPVRSTRLCGRPAPG